MRKIAVITTALLITASQATYAQNSSREIQQRPTSAELGTLTEARIDIVKAALQFTPEQEKYWPAIESAIRSRAKNRQARLSQRAAELGDRSLIEIIRDRNPIEFLNRRSDALSQRAADLKKLADAWDPLYKTLTPEQRRRMALLTLIVLRDMRDALEDRHMQHEYDDDEEG
jgi:hypothetical protein